MSKKNIVLRGLQVTRYRIRYYLLCVPNIVHVGARRQRAGSTRENNPDDAVFASAA